MGLELPFPRPHTPSNVSNITLPFSTLSSNSRLASHSRLASRKRLDSGSLIPTVKRKEPRPVTPLDFSATFAIRQTMSSSRPSPTSSQLPTRKSVDLSLDVVDPAIRGIPQGWDDDPSIPLPTNISTYMSPIPVTHPHPIRDMNGMSFRPSPFRDTRQKIASFGNSVRDRANVKDTRAGGMQRKASIRTGPTARSISMSTAPTLSVDVTSEVFSEGSSISQISVNSSRAIRELDVVPPASLNTDSLLDSSHLFTPTSSQFDRLDSPSVTSTKSSGSRNRVLGMNKDLARAGLTQSRVFLPPNTAEILPFALNRPFASWELPSVSQTPSQVSTGSRTTSKQVISKDRSARWVDLPRPRGALGSKREWLDVNGLPIGGPYKVGWETEVLDLESRLHETMYDEAGGRHTFAEFAEGKEPGAVLDIGTGIGLWPISQALIWSNTTFVGLDMVPCQIDLSLLAQAERSARSTTSGIVEGEGMWSSIEKRITWDRANFLQCLPYDTGVFDMVHIRFIGLGVPEDKWADLLEEATRVLKPGGKLEIVEMSYTLSSAVPSSLRNSFSSLLLAEMIQPVTILPLQFILTATPALDSTTTKPVFEKSWQQTSTALADAVMIWVRSALEYKGTGLVKGSKGEISFARKVKIELSILEGKRWHFGKSDMVISEPLRSDGEATVWAWVITRR
ncbi:hypothetical protein TREMEDRAFT_62314 [Tremella mesenterica DSM 1558]|uniref:uncharacterized protein n=1 Tax=Tremella mesenterica (strain ATCC 24925 / CBS 8224 / DSM 1558 / NBRC 9311 / NRRL Y-6157 / RJB 2259-6 / UBC 559-6) TaxID=578456 RepID=UPI0003F49BFC|nr:uncharacterized protein TREMEDRAFT_62314 [Tremella mesenterica DSM 1558]EIW69448.1 hypothetical protein TREMEDRAFT_62314 [Tremella mesenterica DSM 1558]